MRPPGAGRQRKRLSMPQQDAPWSVTPGGTVQPSPNPVELCRRRYPEGFRPSLPRKRLRLRTQDEIEFFRRSRPGRWTLGLEPGLRPDPLFPGWRSLVGCDEHQVGNTPDAWFQRIHPEDLGAVKRVLEGAVAAGPDEFELRHRMLHQDGSYRWVSCRGVIQWDAEGEAVRISGCHADVTAQAASDPQTGLPNRLLLLERLARSIERAARYPGFHFAVLSIELARPDSPEESLTGADPLLNAVARRLETCLRAREEHPTLRNNDLVARLEGDQFVILLDGLKELGHAVVAADRILAEVLAPYRWAPAKSGSRRASASR